MRTFATLASPGTFAFGSAVRVGRTVANSQFLRALALHSSFEELTFLIGESADTAGLEELTSSWKVPEGRLVVHHVWQLPELLADGAIDVIHHPSHVDRFFDLIAVRDRYAARVVPVTGQIHSLSYPRAHQDFARGLTLTPSLSDAIFCSSEAGKQALAKSWADLKGPGELRLPVIPLGVDLASLENGDRAATRAALEIPSSACVFLCLARFTEYDKADLFPLLQAFQSFTRQHPRGKDAFLLLAGARQGTKTPEMLSLWARALGIDSQLRFKIDFADDEKRNLLAASDVFVSPIDNLQETFGQSVVEALAAGLPCVVSDFSGYRELVDDAVGLRVPTRLGVDLSELSELAPLLYERPLHLWLGQSVEVDLPALEAAMRELFDDTALRERMAKAARTKAAGYDWKVLVPKYEAQWRELSQAAVTKKRSHPLALNFGRVFSHFPSGTIDPSRRVQRSAQATAWSVPGQSYVIYPELTFLFTEDDLRWAIEAAAQPLTVSALSEQFSQRLQGRPGWVSGLFVTWLLKHGLLQTAA